MFYPVIIFCKEIPRVVIAVTIIPAPSTPSVRKGIEFRGCRLKTHATRQPVHAPVSGKGIATSGIKEKRPYLINHFAFCFSSFLALQFKNRCTAVGNLFIWGSIFSRAHGKVMTGIRLPRIPQKKASYHWNSNSKIAKGIDALSSVIGADDRTSICNISVSVNLSVVPSGRN